MLLLLFLSSHSFSSFCHDIGGVYCGFSSPLRTPSIRPKKKCTPNKRSLMSRPLAPTNPDEGIPSHVPTLSLERRVAGKLLPSMSSLPVPSSAPQSSLDRHSAYIPHASQTYSQYQSITPHRYSHNNSPYSAPRYSDWDTSESSLPEPAFVNQSAYQQPSSSISYPSEFGFGEPQMNTSGIPRPSSLGPSVIEPTPRDHQPRVDPFTPSYGYRVPSTTTGPSTNPSTRASPSGSLDPRARHRITSAEPQQQMEDR